MIRFGWFLALIILLVGCVPFQATQQPAPGVAVETLDLTDGGTRIALASVRPIERLFLRVPAATLSNASTEGCTLVGAAVECILESVTTFEMVILGGSLTGGDVVGVACFDTACSQAFEVYWP